MTEINRTTKIEHCGPLPLDLFIYAEIELTNEQETLYVHTGVNLGGDSHFAVDRNSILHPDYETSSDTLEWFDSLIEARNSEYLQLYLDLDKMTDRALAEYLKQLNDTRNYGFRCNYKITNKGIEAYAESFNTSSPELNEYLQIRKREKQTIFSASHYSYYMNMEFGDLYEIEYGHTENEAYLFTSCSLDSLGKHSHFRPRFEQMLKDMEEQLPFTQSSTQSDSSLSVPTKELTIEESILIHSICKALNPTDRTRENIIVYLIFSSQLTNETDPLMNELINQAATKIKSMSSSEWNSARDSILEKAWNSILYLEELT